MMAAVDILVQECRPNVAEIRIDDGRFAAEQSDRARMPIVAIGVLIFRPSPVCATCPATKAKVPSTRLKRAPFAALLGS